MFKNKLTTSIILLSISLLSIFLYAYFWNDDKGKIEKSLPREEIKVTTISQSLAFVPLYIGMEKGFFEEAGLNILLQTIEDRDKAVDEVIKGDSHLLLAGPEASIYMIQEQSPKQLISIAQAVSNSDYLLLARKATAPFKWSDLKGKVMIGYSRGEIQEMVLEYILHKNNLNPLTHVHIIQNLTYKQIPNVFQGGTGDYVIIYEPLATILEKENSGIVLSSLATAGPSLNSYTFMATSNYLRDNKNTAQSFVNAYGRCLRWVLEHPPEDIADIVKRFYPHEDEKTILRGIARYKTMGIWPANPLINETGLDTLQEIMLDLKELNKIIPSTELFDNSFAANSQKSSHN